MLTYGERMKSIQKWTSIPGYPGFTISDHGEVKDPKGKLLKQHLAARNAGVYVHLAGTTRMVHKLMLLAFVGLHKASRNPHRNGNKLDNRLSNLSYGEDNRSLVGNRPKRCSKNHALVGENVEFWGKNRICVACREGKPPNRELPEYI